MKGIALITGASSGIGYEMGYVKKMAQYLVHIQPAAYNTGYMMMKIKSTWLANRENDL